MQRLRIPASPTLAAAEQQKAAARGRLEHLLQEGGVAGAEDAGVHDHAASLRRKRRVHVPQVLRKQEAGSTSQLCPSSQLCAFTCSHGMAGVCRDAAVLRKKRRVHVHQVLRTKSTVSVSSFVCARNSCRVPAGESSRVNCSAESCSSMLTGESGQCRTHLRAYVA